MSNGKIKLKYRYNYFIKTLQKLNFNNLNNELFVIYFKNLNI